VSEYTEKLKNRVWSWSSATQAHECPYGFYLQRLAEPRIEQDENVFAQYGSQMHEWLEMVFKGIMQPEELLELYLTDYDSKITLKWPFNRYVDLEKSYYEDGLAFARHFKGLSPNYEVIGVELEMKAEIEGFKVIGYIDLLVKNKKTGEYIVVDHKSKKKFASKAEEKKYRKQLEFYGYLVHEKMGVWPAYTDLDLFRGQKHYIEPCTAEDCIAAKDYFIESVKTACETEEWLDKHSIKARENFKSANDAKKAGKADFFCAEICSVRSHCPMSSAYVKPKKEKKSKKAGKT